MDLTARDNVIINAVMLGLSRKEARERFDDIIAFAGLEEFVDLKLKNYSSGMYVRLAFATAVQVDADILLIDEVLAVGDAAFQHKCFDELTRLQHAGRTMVFVTHDMGAVERFCDRAMLLERGEVVDIGDPASVARQYNHHNFRRWRGGGRDPRRGAAAGRSRGHDHPCRLRVGHRRDRGDKRPGRIVRGPHEGPLPRRPSTSRRSRSRSSMRPTAPCSPPTPIRSRSTPGRFAAGTEATVRLRFENFLAPGRYLLVASVARPGFGAEVLHAHMTNSIIVVADRPGGGITDLPHTLEIERS